MLLSQLLQNYFDYPLSELAQKQKGWKERQKTEENNINDNMEKK